MTSSLRERALRLLARSEQTRAGLARKLSRHGEPAEIDTLLDELERSGLLSDARYAESFVAARSTRHGSVRLRAALRARGVDEDTIAAHVSADPADELARAHALWVRKFGVAPIDAKDYARQMRYLAARGFGADMIRKILKDAPHEAALSDQS